MEPYEPILEDNYPVYAMYWYVVDGKPQRSNIQGTVLDLKRDTKATEVRRCAAIARGLM